MQTVYRTIHCLLTLNMSFLVFAYSEQDSSVCLDFTLDSGNISLIQRKSANEKLRRRLCCFVLFLLIIGIVLVVVVGISLYLTHGQRYFGPI